MKALVYHGPKDLKFQEIKTPRPGEDEVMIEVKATGICGADIHGFHGIRRIAPMIMGHEFSGVIKETGKNANKFKKGDRVTVQPVIFCGACPFCRQGLTNLCLNKGHLGVLDVNGSLAEYITVKEKLVYKLPEKIDYLKGAMIEPLSVAYSAINRAPGLEGKYIFIAGMGPIGLLILQIAKLKKPLKIITADIDEHRLSLAKKLGADFTLNPKNTDISKTINSITDNKGIDISFEAVGISNTVQMATNNLRERGSCIWVGNAEEIVEINMKEVVLNELNISGSYSYTHEEFGQVVELLDKNDINLDALITKTVPLAESKDIFTDIDNGIKEMIKIIITN